MTMPEMDGNEFLDKLEHEDLLKEQKIIIMTAHGLSALEIELLMSKPGVCWFLKKPLQLSELLETIESLNNLDN